MIDAGRLNAEQARLHPKRNVITRVLGAGTQEHPDYWLLPVAEHDRWLVCSDGLTSEVPDHVIARTLMTETTPQDVVDSLVNASLMAGGRDNVSVIVVDAWRNDDDQIEATVEQVPNDAMAAWSATYKTPAVGGVEDNDDTINIHRLFQRTALGRKSHEVRRR